MAIITTPGAGVSPYQTTDTDPTVLRAAANGATVLANAATAAATADTVANTSVYVAGQAALNSLITSNQPGVFQGANVNITLEEQQFVTNNQVTATTNYADGATGSIQYNNGANGFAGDAYFTYTNSNIITPGIRTDSYLYANGAPFLAGGNAAIGNFVFTGDNMTIAHANSTLSVTGNGTGNIQVTSNGNTWIFNSDGNLTIPGNIVGANVISANAFTNLTGAGNVLIQSSKNQTGPIATWTFDPVSDGTGNMIFPTGMHISSDGFGGTRISQNSNGASATLRVTAGNANGRAVTGWGEDETPGVGNLAVVAYNLASNPSNVAIITGNLSATSYTWTFANGGNLILPANTFAVNYANGDPVVISSSGLPLANGTSNIDIATANGNVTITANGSPTWTFKSDGNLSLPTAGNIVGAVNIIGNGTGNVNVEANGRAWTFAADGNLVLPIAGNIVNNGYVWNFDTTGNLTLPSSLIVPANSIITGVGASPAPSINGFDTINAITFSASGNITGGNVLTVGTVKTGSFVTGTIPAAAGAGAGARAFVTDADSIIFGNLYVGGSGNAMPVWSNGTNWYIG